MANMPYKLSYSFEGNCRQRPEQNLSGASRKETREVLLSRAHNERQKRQEQRSKLKSAVIIQSYVRSYSIRKSKKDEHRRDFDVTKTTSELNDLLRKFLFFYDPHVDRGRLVDMCVKVVSDSDRLLKEMQANNSTDWLLKRFLVLCLNALLDPDSCEVSLQTIQTFTQHSTLKNDRRDVWPFLIDKGFFAHVRKLLDSNPERCDRVTNLIVSAFSSVPSLNRASATQFLTEFCAHFLCQRVTPALKSILVRLRVSEAFHYGRVVQFLKEETDRVDNNNYLLYCVLTLEPANFETTKDGIIVLSVLTANLHQTVVTKNVDDCDDSDEEEMEIDDEEIGSEDYTRLLNQNERVKRIVMYFDRHHEDSELLHSLVQLCQNLLLISKDSIRRYMLLFMLALKGTFLNGLWQSVKREKDDLLQACSTSPLNLWGNTSFGSSVSVFCEMFTFYTQTLTDSESTDTSSTFSHSELSRMATVLKTLALNLVDVAFPMCKPSTAAPREAIRLYGSTLSALRVLHTLDLRKNFCKPEFWTQRKIHVSHDLCRRNYLSKIVRPFGGVTREQDEDERLPPLSTIEQRSLCVLQQLPFLIEFNTRVLLMRDLCRSSLGDSEGARLHGEFLNDSTIVIRRTHLYEDAFAKLSGDNESDLRQKVRIQFVNAMGLDEAGFDGGGIFKEFIDEVLKTSFDPNRGFFLLTNENTLYPNPNVHLIVENFTEHYYFIGRLLGKAIFENILVDLPLAEFFLYKLLWDRASAFYLKSLDPILFRNLLYLRDYPGDVQDLGLDFTCISNDLGETKVVELKPNGRNISVTNYNRVEYIHKLTDLKLNVQIKKQCAAFREGLNSVVPLLWLRLFSHYELQVIISGDNQEIDVGDMKAHTAYGGEFAPDHATILLFWDILEHFTEVQKKQLLKFVTSCSRPPLLGFKELNPAFCIQSSGTDRMPTASTCLNLLKLPVIKDKQVLKERLLASIEQQAGFELS